MCRYVTRNVNFSTSSVSVCVTDREREAEETFLDKDVMIKRRANDRTAPVSTEMIE